MKTESFYLNVSYFVDEIHIVPARKHVCNIFSELNVSIRSTAESTQLPATDCEHMTCYFGAYCVIRSGLATCECGAPECAANEAPSVCGSDGRTYLSACHLRSHACRSQSDIVVQAFGPCGGEAPTVRRGSRSADASNPSRTKENSIGQFERTYRTSYVQFTDASVDTSDSGKPDSPEPELTCIDILPPMGYR